MDIETALSIIDQGLASIVANRETHTKLIEALSVIERKLKADSVTEATEAEL